MDVWLRMRRSVRQQEWNRQSRGDRAGQGLMQNGRRAGGAYQWAGTDGKMQRLQWAERRTERCEVIAGTAGDAVGITENVLG